MTTLILGTRGSDLALAQTRIVSEKLRAAHPALALEPRIIKTIGDERLDVKLSAPGSLDKGLFTKELEEALLRGEIHVAIHSLKDVPTERPRGLVIGAILERANVADVLVSKAPGGLDAVPLGATIATSSLRRKNQLLHLRPDLDIIDIRGNVPTRLRKLAESDWAGIILAQAGLDRLGSGIVPVGLHVAALHEMLPAPGQGAIAVECRADDSATLDTLAAVHHHETAACVQIEREILSSLGGGCSVPLGVRAWMENGEMRVQAALFEGGTVRWLRQA